MAPRFVQELDAAAEVRDYDGAADESRHVEGFPQLFVLSPDLDALVDVVGDAVVAAEHHRRDQAQELLGLGGEGAVLVGMPVREKNRLPQAFCSMVSTTVMILTCPSTKPQLAAPPDLPSPLLPLCVRSPSG